MPAKNVVLTAKWGSVKIYFPDFYYGGYVVADNAAFTPNSNVAFTAMDYKGPQDGEYVYTFVGWYDEEDNFVTAERTNVITIPESDLLIYPRWMRFTYKFTRLNVDTSEEKSTYPKEKQAGKTFNYTSIDADANRDILGFFDENDNLITTDPEFTFTMPARDYVIYVKYREYHVILQQENADAGRLDLRVEGSWKPNNDSIAAYGSEIKCRVYSALGYVFDGWYDGSERVSQSLSYTFDMPRRHVTLTAKWLPNVLSIEGEDVIMTDHYATDGKVTLCPETKTGAWLGTWAGWYCNGELLTRDYELIVDPTVENAKYVATRIIDPVSAVCETENSGKVTWSYCALVGDDCTVEFRPYIGYEFVGWYENDALVSSNASFKIACSDDKRVFTAKTAIKEELQAVEFTSTETTCTITGVKDKTLTEYVISNYVTAIADNAFKDCANLTSLTISATVKSIGDYAFSGCASLIELTYKSDKDEWNKISLKSNWYKQSSLTIIRCANGVEIAAPKDEAPPSIRI